MPKRKAAFENFDPRCWRGSCELVVENFRLIGPPCVQRRCVMGSGEESCDCRQQIGQWAGVPWNLSPRGILFDKDVDCGSWGEDVEDVDVVVFPFRPPVSKVQGLKRKVCTVGRESGGGNEVLQEVSTFLPVEPLSGRKRRLPWKAPPTDCPLKCKHVFIRRERRAAGYRKPLPRSRRAQLEA